MHTRNWLDNIIIIMRIIIVIAIIITNSNSKCRLTWLYCAFNWTFIAHMIQNERHTFGLCRCSLIWAMKVTQACLMFWKQSRDHWFEPLHSNVRGDAEFQNWQPCVSVIAIFVWYNMCTRLKTWRFACYANTMQQLVFILHKDLCVFVAFIAMVRLWKKPIQFETIPFQLPKTMKTSQTIENVRMLSLKKDRGKNWKQYLKVGGSRCIGAFKLFLFFI